MNYQTKNLSTPEGIKDAMVLGYLTILEEITPYDRSTIKRVIGGMKIRHRAWPVIWALANEGEIAAREISSKLGWLNQTAA